LSFRALHDENGHTGPFLILMLAEAASAQRAAERMKAGGLHNIARLADYGMHVYYNLPALVNRVPLSPAGNPWNLPQNQAYDYRAGACPQSDALFARSILVPIPSRLTRAQEGLAVRLIREAVTGA
jgi:8-amino-3,8-dideoxy-alpha-D-manno-octulosonate transaminase